MKTVLFLGFQGSGKTASIFHLTRALTRRGYIVGTAKHIHKGNFSVSEEAKDTSVHARAGARIVVAVSPHEFAIIRRGDYSSISMDSLVKVFSREKNVDFLLVEGFYSRLSRRKGVIKILCARSKADVDSLIHIHGLPACIVSRLKNISSERVGKEVPVFHLPRDTNRLLKLIEEEKK